MLKLHLIEIVLRAIPEMLFIVFGIHIVVKKTILIKKYILSSVILGILAFLIRMLPIYFGIHTLIMVILTICVMAIIDTPIIKAIYGTLLMFLLLSFSEFLNVAILNFFNVNTNIQFANPIIKSVFGMPALVILYLFIIAIRHYMRRKDEFENVVN